MPKNTIEEKIDKLTVAVAENFAVLKIEVSGIKDHLSRLNSKVAQHEANIHKHEQDALVENGRFKTEISKVKLQLDNIRKPYSIPAWVTIILPIFSALVVFYLTK